MFSTTINRNVAGIGVALCLLAGGCADPQPQASRSLEAIDAPDVMLIADVEWQQLNPARGDQSPKAGTLWGDRVGPGAGGFLLRPVDGFRSPPHIHNIAYRGVVIQGLLHNDDPDAADMWMPAASFWTQPAGEIHVTAAKGPDVLAYIEVEDDFGVLPATEAFPDPGRPVNIDASNLVWVEQGGIDIAYLWGTPKHGHSNGVLVRLPIGFTGGLQSGNDAMYAVVITGLLGTTSSTADGRVQLEPGSSLHAAGGAVAGLSNDGSDACILYVRSSGHVSPLIARR